MLALLPLLLCSLRAFGAASPVLSHEATPAEIQRAVTANAAFHQRATRPDARPLHPVEDTARFAYVLMSGYDQGDDEVKNLRRTIAQNLPAGVKLVLLVDDGDAAVVREEYAQWISPDRLILATDADTQSGFWARDSFPIPVYADASKKVSLVAANYYRDFNAQGAVAKAANGAMAKKEFTFVGGNLLSDEDGNCFSVNSYRLFTVTTSDLQQAYGCRTTHLMNHVRGLGDADEVLKPLGNHRMLTNSPEYKAELESLGYQVILLPTNSEPYRTYTNALVVNGTVFMPSYGVDLDDQAAKVYEGLGFKVVRIPTNMLSDDEHGSVHCQTMAYPAMAAGALLESLGLREARLAR
jgi:hypothetical protein